MPAKTMTPDLPDQMDGPDAAASAQSAAPGPGAPPATAKYPDWYIRQNAAEAAQASTPATSQPGPTSASGGTPSWYAPETAQPDWLGKLDQQGGAGPASSTAAPTQPQDPSAARNFITGLLRIPGAVLGAPAVIKHANNWAEAKVLNWLYGTNLTGADIDKTDPVMKVLPTAQGVDREVFNANHVTPYEPTSPLGQVGQAVTTGIGAGLVDPLAVAGDISWGASAVRAAAHLVPNALKTGAAAGVANGVQQLAPDEPGIAAAAALLTHAGLSGAGAVAKLGSGLAADTVRQVVQPAKQGQIEAGRVLAPVDNTQPGLANPTAADLATATGGVKATTDAIGPGLPDWQAGAQLRAGLQGRADTLKAARAATADEAYAQFRQQPALPATELQPFMQSPSFRKALGAANGAVLDEGGEPLTDYFGLADDDTPSFLKGNAIPTDVLHRIKSQLGDAVSAAPAGSAAQRTATMLNNRFGEFLEQQYPARDDFPGYAAIRQNYAAASKPLDPMTYGPVAKTLDTDTQFGRSRYTLPDERVPDLFLRSGATRADLNQLVDAFGGDKAAATSALEQHLAGVAQTAVRPDGTLDAGAFDKAMAPYQRALPNMGIWFPNLAGKFASAKAAQGTLDTLQTQRGLADAVSGGALRDGNGAVTGASFGKWLGANKDALAKTQNPAAVLRLQSIANALQGAKPGELADALKSEILPAAVGTATMGLEGGVLGTLLHKVAGAAFDGADAKRQAAFSAAIERAALDPDYASRIAAASGRQGRGLSPVRALVRAVALTPMSVIAGNRGPTF